MNAILSIEIELNVPVLVDSAFRMHELRPSQVRRLSIGLAAGDETVNFTVATEDGRASLRDLVDLAQKAQPEGTPVRVWYQGRSESLVI